MICRPQVWSCTMKLQTSMYNTCWRTISLHRIFFQVQVVPKMNNNIRSNNIRLILAQAENTLHKQTLQGFNALVKYGYYNQLKKPLPLFIKPCFVCSPSRQIMGEISMSFHRNAFSPKRLFTERPFHRKGGYSSLGLFTEYIENI